MEWENLPCLIFKQYNSNNFFGAFQILSVILAVSHQLIGLLLDIDVKGNRLSEMGHVRAICAK